MAIYTLVIAGVWQASGFVMAMFLAGLRGIDQDIIKAASIDGARPVAHLPAHRHPAAAPGVFVGLVILAHLAIKSYDLVVALTGGGPGYATELPSTFMYALHVHAQPARHGRRERGDDAADDRRDHGALPLFRTARAQAWLMSDRHRPPCDRSPTAQVIRTGAGRPHRHLRRCSRSSAAGLPAAALGDGAHLVQAARRSTPAT